MLSMLGGVVSDTAVQRAMSDYAKAWRFKHRRRGTTPFYMSTALRVDLGWFWNYWLYTTEAVNESIPDVTSKGNKTIVTVRQDGQMPSPVVLKCSCANREGDQVDGRTAG